MNDLISIEIARMSAYANSQNVTTPVTGADAISQYASGPAPRDLGEQLLALHDIFHVADITANSPEFVAALMPHGKTPVLRCMCVARNADTNTEHVVQLFLGTFVKKAKNSEDNSIRQAIVKMKDGTLLSFDNCATQLECWKLLANKNFRVTAVHEVPVIKRDFQTKIAYNAVALIYDFEEI